MKITPLIVLFSIMSMNISIATAQSKKVYVSTSVGVTGLSDNNIGLSTNLTVGYSVSPKIRLDVMGSHAFLPNNPLSHASILLSPQVIRKKKIIFDPSIGVGALRNHSTGSSYFIIPIKGNLGYRITNRTTAGVEMVIPGLYKESDATHWGAFVSFKF